MGLSILVCSYYSDRSSCAKVQSHVLLVAPLFDCSHFMFPADLAAAHVNKQVVFRQYVHCVCERERER